MLKKIVLGGVITAMSAGLIYGGVTRTAARAETGEASREGSGQGKGRTSELSSYRENENERGFENGQRINGNRDNTGSDQFGGEWSGTGNEDYQTMEYLGTVADVTSDWMAIRLENGSEILVENRAWWYAQDAGFTAAAGDPVQVKGFIDDEGVFEASMLLNLNSGAQVEIRGEQGGRPNWAGGGGGGGNRGGAS